MKNMRKLFINRSNILLNESQAKLNYNEPSIFTSTKMNKMISMIRHSLSQSHLHQHNQPSFSLYSSSSNNNNTNNNNNTSTNYTLLSNKKTFHLTNINSITKPKRIINQYKSITNNVKAFQMNKKKINEALYRKIFPKIYLEKTEDINNLHNIIYSESPIQFEKQFAQLQHDKEQGKIMNYHGTQIDSRPVFKRLDYIKNQLHFYRNISEFVYPQVVVMKIKEKQKLMKRNQQRVRMNMEQKKKKIVKSLSTGSLNVKDVYNVKVYSNNCMENKEVAWMNIKRRGKKG
jgi:hypothetical protein